MLRFLLFVWVALSLLLSGCGESKKEGLLVFGVSADYPPFEYSEDGELVGFDIDLAKLVAKELGKEAVFKDMQFATIFSALKSGDIDAGISMIGATEEREKSFDFSDVYYQGGAALLYNKADPIVGREQMAHKKIACQVGSVMELWLDEHASGADVRRWGDIYPAVEALKAGHIDGVLMDELQARSFAEKNGMGYSVIAEADGGSSIVFKKGSELKNQVNDAIRALTSRGEMQELKDKWL